jgi:iron complex transport system substrate-binding protein
MSASVSEMLFAIGVTPVGVTADMDYPPAAADLPTFGSGYQPDLEALAALEPDLIIANAQLNMQFMDQLQAIAPTLPIMTLVPADIPANIRILGQATWHDTSAEYLARSYEGFLTAMGEAATGKEGPSILIIVGTLDAPNYGKSETYLGDMAKRLGATNIADGQADAGPFPGYAQLSAEYIVDNDPDFIFTVTLGAPTPMPETMAGDPVWSALTAVQTGHAIELDSRLFVEAPGPRFIDAMLQLWGIFYGEGM